MLDANQQIEAWQDLFATPTHYCQLLESIRKGEKVININFNDIAQQNPELANSLLDDPEEALKTGEIAISQLDAQGDTKHFIIRISNLYKDTHIPISDIRRSHLGKLISVEGTIRQTTSVRPKITVIQWACPGCGTIITVLQTGQTIKEPAQCGCGRKGKFHKQTQELIDIQKLVLEEPIDKIEGTKQPERLNILLSNDLVNPHMTLHTTPGSRVLISGILRDVPQKIAHSKAESTERELMLDANYIQITEETFESINITKEDIKEIIELSKDPKLFTKMVNSYAPAIEGHRDIKKAIILQAFGGVNKEVAGSKKHGNIHILLTGDPGMSKTQMIRYGETINPKYRYTAGGGSSAVGLTASVVKDEFLGGFALEAGALVLANNGIAILDEFDKMKEEDRGALHEGMTECQFSINKANIHSTLMANTTILAAANPKYGRFDLNSSGGLASQIDLPSSLINRFDLIFAMMDTISEEEDKRIVEKIIQAHANPEKISPPIQPQIFKKYISYAKKNCIPKLTKEAQEMLKEFYLHIRQRKKASRELKDIVPINPRQMDTMVKLSEASAKLELRNKVEAKDVKRAKKILINCLEKIAIDPETGQLDIDRLSIDTPKSARDKIHIFNDIFSEQATILCGQPIPIETIIEEARKKGIMEDEAEELLNKMRKVGEIYEPYRGKLKRME